MDRTLSGYSAQTPDVMCACVAENLGNVAEWDRCLQKGQHLQPVATVIIAAR